MSKTTFDRNERTRQNKHEDGDASAVEDPFPTKNQQDEKETTKNHSINQSKVESNNETEEKKEFDRNQKEIELKVVPKWMKNCIIIQLELFTLSSKPGR
jgi:hypothetical protein